MFINQSIAVECHKLKQTKLISLQNSNRMKKITLLLIFCFGIQVSIAQNTCATALLITAGTTTVPTIDGTNIVSTCSTAALAKWYRYTPAINYTVTITSDLAVNICGDTDFNVYTGTCGALLCYSGDDDSGVIACNSGNANSYLSTATFTAFAGTTYYIAWDNHWSALGFDFQLTETTYVAPIPPPVTFTTQSFGGTSTICCIADMNGDYLDDIVTVGATQVNLYNQKTNGGYDALAYPLTVNFPPNWSIAAGDFDRNGYNDLALGNGSRVSVVKAAPGGVGYTITEYPQNIFTQRTNFIDINNDGNLDLWACHDVAQSHAYRNDGEGNLLFDISLMPTLAVGGNYQSQWTDIDSDGDMDMYLSKCRASAPVNDPQRINLLYKNNGNGTYSETGAAAGINDGSQSWSSAIEDYDNDGDLDILLSNISDTNKLYRNNGDGTFTDIYSTTGIAAQVGSWELQAADFDNDGWMDFLWQNGKELYMNNHDMTFSGFDLPFSEGAIGDLNNDGFLDVQFSGTAYMNTPNANHYLTVNLQGIQSNRNGIGARVEIYGTFGKQVREIKSGNGFSHQSSLNAHFGLGTATEITQIIVRWPSGIVDTYDTPAIDGSVLVVEGATLAVNTYTNSEFSLYPNPAKHVVTIKTKNNIEMKSAQIFDLNGRLILKSELTNSSIAVDGLNTGTYILLLRDRNGKDYSQKFIKE